MTRPNQQTRTDIMTDNIMQPSALDISAAAAAPAVIATIFPNYTAFVGLLLERVVGITVHSNHRKRVYRSVNLERRLAALRGPR